MNRWFFAATVVSATSMFASTEGRAQSGDAAICSALQSSRSGIYLKYPSGDLVSAGAGALQYHPGVRIFFLGRSRQRLATRQHDHVWHVRTQTRAEGAGSAETVLVYRPPVETRCTRKGRGGPLRAFDEDQRFVSIPTYADHHAPAGGDWAYRRDTGLRTFFHLALEDERGERSCTQTDDRKAFPRQWELYGFHDVPRGESRNVTALSFAGPARADLGQFAGLTSEFRYPDAEARACFELSAPLPTRTFNRRLFGPNRLELARDAAESWQPRQTTIMAQRLQNRDVKERTHHSIAWTGGGAR